MSTEDPKEAFGEDFLIEDFTIKWTNTDRGAVPARTLEALADALTAEAERAERGE